MIEKDAGLGIDFGGLIIPMIDNSQARDTQFSDLFLSTRSQRDAFRAIGALTAAFGGRVWIVSKAGERTEALTRQRLEAMDFFHQTRLDEDHPVLPGAAAKAGHLRDVGDYALRR